MFPIEPFTGSLITARDPSFLGDGDLIRADNCIIRPYAPGVHKAPGRTTYGTTGAAAATKGLRYLRFNGKTTGTLGPRLLAYSGTTYYISTFTAETGSFASLATDVGDGATVDSVHFDNRYYLLNGNSTNTPNRVVTVDDAGVITTRRQGLDPVSYALTVASAASAGWPSNADFGDGAYFFFCTEVAKTGINDEVESAVSDNAIPGSLFMTGTTNGVTITLPATLDNPEATHRRIYIIGPKADYGWSTLFLVDAQAVAEIPKEQVTLTLGASAPLSEKKAPTVATTSGSGWSNANGALARADLSTAKRSYSNDANGLLLSTFGFTTGSFTTITGITVAVRFARTTDVSGNLFVEISKNGSAGTPTYGRKETVKYSGLLGSLKFGNGHPTTMTTLTAGGVDNLWGYTSFAASDFSNTNFLVRISSGGVAGDSGNRIAIDYVEVTVHYGTNKKVEKGVFYPVVVTQAGPIVAVNSANGEPPVASTGDIFEGQMLLNDVANPGLIRASLPDNPECFPGPYYLNLSAQKEADDVRLIRRVRDKVVVGLTSSIQRVNFMPRAEDPEFERGRAFEPITEQHGIPGPFCAAKFTAPGSAEMLAYVNAVGAFVTDAQTADPLTNDLEWANTVNIDRVSLFQLVDYPPLHSLLLYYIPAGDSTSSYPTRMMQFCYHPNHRHEDGTFKAMGPTVVDTSASCVGRINDVPILLTGSSAGHTISVEDRGAGSAEVDIVTREIFPNGWGGKGRTRKLFVRHLTANPFLEVLVTPFYNETGDTITTPRDGGEWTPRSFRNNAGGAVEGAAARLTAFAGLASVDMDFSAESYFLRFQSRPVTGQATANLCLIGWSHDDYAQGQTNSTNA